MDYQGTSKYLSVKMTDIFGRVVYQNDDKKEEINAELNTIGDKLSVGVYFLVVDVDGKIIYRQNIIKNQVFVNIIIAGI